MNKTIIFLSIPLFILLMIVSCIGLLTPGFYSAETLNWQAQSVGQDIVNLFFIGPCLLITSIMAYRSINAIPIWGGVMLYLIYTFVLYCFDVHFNKLFLLYCFCLGLSFYSFIFFLFAKSRSHETVEIKSPNRFIGIYFIIVSVLFYFLWLAEIIPASIQNTIPDSVSKAGLFTNGVHVLDLAVILPAIFITGILLLKKKPFGFVLTPVFLTFFILMDVTIGTLAVVMKSRGIGESLLLTVVMGVLASFSLVLLIWFLKSLKTIPG